MNVNIGMMQASSEETCKRACKVENEFLCRSYLYRRADEAGSDAEYNCQLYHLDHYSLPDGPSTFINVDRPLLDDGKPIGTFAENICLCKSSPLLFCFVFVFVSS